MKTVKMVMPDGITERDVAENLVDKAVAKGYKTKQDAETSEDFLVDLVMPDGTPHKVKNSLVNKALDKGYTAPGIVSNSKANEAEYGSVGKVEAAARGVAQAGSLGLSDELAGAAKSPIGAMQQAREYFGGEKADPNNPDVKAYTAERDMQRARDQQGEDTQQLASGAGNFLGAGATIGSSVPALFAQGAASAAGMSNQTEAKNDVQSAGISGVLNTVLGSIAPVVSKGRDMLENYAVKRAGVSGEQFLNNPALIKKAQEVPLANTQLRNEIDDLASTAAVKGEEGLRNLRSQTNARYDELGAGLADVDGPNFSQFNDTVNALLDDSALLPATRKRVIDGIQQIISQPGQTTGQQANQISRFLTQVGGKKPAFLSTDLERSSAEALKNSAYKARDIFQQELGALSPEIAQSGKNALDAAKTEITTREFLRKKFGSKGINDKVTLDSARIAVRAPKAGDAISRDMVLTGQNAGIGQELASIRNKADLINKNKTLASELTNINKPASISEKILSTIPGVRGVGGTPLNTIEMYNTINSLFNKPALTAAVKMINGAGRTLSYQTIQQLAQQHNVDPDELQAVMSQQNPD